MFMNGGIHSFILFVTFKVPLCLRNLFAAIISRSFILVAGLSLVLGSWSGAEVQLTDCVTA